MTILKEKSTFNFDAANLLIGNNLYAPSVHCSYYSCFQLIKYTIKDFMDLSYAELELEVQKAKKDLNINSHAYIIRKIGNEIKSYSSTEYAEFKRNIGDLKVFREKSDYDDEQIDIEKSQKAHKLASTVRAQIQEIFNV